MDNFGFCVWLLVKNPSYWNSVRNRFANHITKFPLHITVQSGFTNKNDAFKYMKSYTIPHQCFLYTLATDRPLHYTQ